ncbi:hypothetical protein CVT25_013370, partial [Psilocybe cyanescens]
VDEFKHCAGERNEFFDSEVLSRRHAEVWEEGGKIYIKDIKSSNRTFINDEWLSSKGHKLDPFELKSDDIDEFSIDIIGEDNKTIIHDQAAHHGDACAAACGYCGLGGVGGIGVGEQPPGVIGGLGEMNGGRKRKRSPSNAARNSPKT